MRIILILIITTFFNTFSERVLAKEVLKQKGRQSLIVFTNPSFPKWYGKYLKENFEKKYNCELRYINSNGAQHLKVATDEKSSIDLDLVIGIDYDTIGIDEIRDNFDEHEIDLSSSEFTVPWNDTKLIPYQKAVLAFIYNQDRVKESFSSFEDIVSKDVKVIIMDPRTSCTGLGLISWIKKVYGDQSGAFWKRMNKKVLTITRGWSEAYALFMRGECDLVLGYLSSPAFHRIKENKPNIKAIIQDEGQYPLYYVVGVLKKSRKKRLARIFIRELLSNENQEKMVYYDWVHPILKLQSNLPFEYNISKKEIKRFSPDEVSKHKSEWVDEWVNSYE